MVKRSAKPDFARLGKRLGKLMKAVNARVRSMTDEEIRSYIETGHVSFEVDGETVLLRAEDLDVTSEGVEGLLVGQEDGVTVALDTAVDDELRSEGYAREVVNRLQNMRKSADFDVTDRIQVGYLATPGLTQALERHAPAIRNETLALEFVEAPKPEGDLVDSYRIGDEQVTLAIRKVVPA